MILTSLDHQEDNQSLKSPVITDKYVSFISCRKLSGICEKHLVSSVILMSLDHQEDSQSLKSPVITDKYVLLFF